MESGPHPESYNCLRSTGHQLALTLQLLLGQDRVPGTYDACMFASHSFKIYCFTLHTFPTRPRAMEDILLELLHFPGPEAREADPTSEDGCKRAKILCST